MNTIHDQKLNEMFDNINAKRYYDGTPNEQSLHDYIHATRMLYKHVFIDDSRNKNKQGLLRTINRSMSTGLVLNSILTDSLRSDGDVLLQMNHENIEKILYIGHTQNYCIWITPLFVTKLKTVWVKIEQFRIYDVKKMFLDLLNGLEYMKLRHITSGVIHEDNMAYNGTSWYISGIFNAKKTGESCSGQYVTPSLKSPRYYSEYDNSEYNNNPILIPEDDLWQLILMYVITYYGFNPFQNDNSIFSATRGTLQATSIFQMLANVLEKKCQDITLSGEVDSFGSLLKTLLTSVNLEIYGYNLFRYIIEHNATQNTEGLNNILTPEIIASLKLVPEKVVSVNIDQYVTKFKECECVICFSETIRYRFKHCNHEVCCHNCYIRIGNKCPMCRQIIEATEELSEEDLEKIENKRKDMYFKVSSI